MGWQAQHDTNQKEQQHIGKQIQQNRETYNLEALTPWKAFNALSTILVMAITASSS